MQKLNAAQIGKVLALCVAVVCSAVLTLITIVPPIVAGDWARLDSFGKYIPNPLSYHWPSYELQFSLWLGLMLALWWVFTSTPFRYIPNIPNDTPLLYIMLLVGITLLGFGLRLSTLDHLPLLVDEIGFAARASDILHGQHISIFAPGHNGNPATFSWLLSGAMGLFGQNRFVMRLVSLAFGMMSIPAAYALGRAWWSRPVGLIAAVFLATYPGHIYFSRLALYNIVDPFFALLALAVLAGALRRMRLADFVWAGTLAGIAQYFYHGLRLLPPLMVVYILFWILNAKAQRRKGAKKNQSHRRVALSLCHVFCIYLVFSAALCTDVYR